MSPQPSSSTNIYDSLQNVTPINLENDLCLTDSSEDFIPDSNECSSSSSNASENILAPQQNATHVLSAPVILSTRIVARSNSSVIDNVTNISGIESIIPGGQNRNRKRKGFANPNEWKKNSRRINRQKGEPYLSSKGTLIPGKMLIPGKCMGLCREKCIQKFTEDERVTVFSSYWNIQSLDQKRQYIVSLIKREQPKTRKTTTINENKRKYTNRYYIPKPGTAEPIKVCQKFFLSTFNITETFVRYCLKKISDTGVVDIDHRGKHIPHNKILDETRQFIKEHINSFPRMPSHYVRKDTKKEYLDQELSLSKMYELYQEKCQNLGRDPVKIHYYRSVFKEDFNIAFYRPRKDMCDKCFIYSNMSEEEKLNKEEEHNEHIKRKMMARDHRDEAKQQAESGLIHFAEYDLEAICNCPSSSSKMIYYKRRISVFNFSLLDFAAQRKVHCFCWHEGIGRKGAIEIGSCLLKYLREKDNGKDVTFMSDTCASQCRNMYISALLLFCVETLNIPIINQKYFEAGHSQMEADNIHATIEQAKKNIPIFHPSGYYTIMRTASRKNPYTVHEMSQEDFLNLKELKKSLIKNVKFDTDGNNVNWLNIRWLQYRKEDVKHIYFKYNLDDADFKMFKIVRRGKRPAIDKIVLKKAYEGPLPISREKFNDLQDLCRARVIPDQYHEFYNSFIVGNDDNDAMSD